MKGEMRLSLWCAISYAWLCCYGVRNVFAYKIPNIKMEVFATGFRVSIPHDAGINMAIFNIEINEQCPLLLDMVTEQRGKLWTSEQPARKLQKNDKVKINVLVTHKEGLFSRTDSVQLSNNFTIIYDTIKEADQPIDTCAANTDTNFAIRGTETKVIINNKPVKRIFKRHELVFEELFKTNELPNWTFSNFIHSNAIGDQSEDFTALIHNNVHATVADGILRITPLISKLNSTSILKVPNCRNPTCYENNNHTCEYKKEKNRFYMHPPPVNSARISTKEKFSFTYGRIEVNATLPNGDWLFPYIMLTPDNLNCHRRKQLRIAFATSVDLENNRIRGGPVILQSKENASQNSKHFFNRISHMATHTNFDAAGYHNFTMIWTSKGIGMYVDGKEYGCSVNNGEYAEPYHIVLGVGAGGSLEFENKYMPWKNGNGKAFAYFHRSFQGCCSSKQYNRNCKDNFNNMRTCSRSWGPQATMAVKSVRVFAV